MKQIRAFNEAGQRNIEENIIHEGQTLYEGYVDMITGFNIRCWTVTDIQPGRVHLKRSIWGCPIYEARNIKEIGATIFLQVDQCIEAFK